MNLIDLSSFQEVNGQRQLTWMQQFDYIREAGTAGEAKAAQAILDNLKEMGIPAETESFEIDRPVIHKASLSVTVPYEETLTAAGYGGCSNTPEGGITAPFYYAENGDPISLSQASGKIVMINQPARPDMVQRLVKAGAVGFITITGTPIDEGEDLIPANRSLPPKAEISIPGIILHHVDAVRLVESGAQEVCLTLQQEVVKATSQNVIARVAGTDLADEVLTLTAHYDSVPAGKGAYDNLAGAAIIMEVLRYFAAHQPRRTIEFVWFGAEERGLVGSRHYVTAREAEMTKHQFNMNVDLAGQLIGGTVIGVTGDASICTLMESMAAEIGLGIGTKNQIWGSDSNSFAWKGVPAMTLNRDGFGMHTRHDTLDLISPWSLERSARLLTYIAARLDKLPVMPFPRQIPEEFATHLSRFMNR